MMIEQSRSGDETASAHRLRKAKRSRRAKSRPTIAETALGSPTHGGALEAKLEEIQDRRRRVKQTSWDWGLTALRPVQRECPRMAAKSDVRIITIA
eukprot:scaffold39271_cov30-Tisochrysis_lutea.AAC.1